MSGLPSSKQRTSWSERTFNLLSDNKKAESFNEQAHNCNFEVVSLIAFWAGFSVYWVTTTLDLDINSLRAKFKKIKRVKGINGWQAIFRSFEFGLASQLKSTEMRKKRKSNSLSKYIKSTNTNYKKINKNNSKIITCQPFMPSTVHIGKKLGGFFFVIWTQEWPWPVIYGHQIKSVALENLRKIIY